MKRLRLMNFKVSDSERAEIMILADKYADRNLSVWLRYAAMNCVPKRADLEEQE